MSINVSKEELFNMYMELRERLDLIEGRPRGPITMREARLANERGDKATLQQYYRQFEKQIPATPRSQHRPAETQVAELRQADRITRLTPRQRYEGGKGMAAYQESTIFEMAWGKRKTPNQRPHRAGEMTAEYPLAMVAGVWQIPNAGEKWGLHRPLKSRTARVIRKEEASYHI